MLKSAALLLLVLLTCSLTALWLTRPRPLCFSSRGWTGLQGSGAFAQAFSGTVVPLVRFFEQRSQGWVPSPGEASSDWVEFKGPQGAFRFAVRRSDHGMTVSHDGLSREFSSAERREFENILAAWTCCLPRVDDQERPLSTRPYQSSRELRLDIDNKGEWAKRILVEPVNEGMRLRLGGYNPFSRLGFRDRDILISLNGQRLDKIERLQYVISELAADSSLHVVIQRQGKVVALEVELPD